MHTKDSNCDLIFSFGPGGEVCKPSGFLKIELKQKLKSWEE